MVKKTNPGAVVGIVAGIAVIIIAIVMLGGTVQLSENDLSTSAQFQLSYSFGADFYTEMFGVTYNVLEQLEDMSKDNAANIAKATNTVTNTITRSIAYVVLAIGAGVFGLSFSKLYFWVPSDIHSGHQAAYLSDAPEKTRDSEVKEVPAEDTDPAGDASI